MAKKLKSFQGYYAIIWHNQIIGYSREKRGMRILNFQGYRIKSRWNFQGIWRKNYLEYSWVLSWFLTLELLRGAIQVFIKNFQGWMLVFSGISRGKVINLKIPKVFFQKYILNLPLLSPLFGLFSEITLLSWEKKRQLENFRAKMAYY